jgi:large subunit ribosomal protein L30
MAAKLLIKLVKSPIGCKPNHRQTVRALGLRRMNAEVEKEATPAVVGMVKTVSYLLDVKEIG